MRMPVTAVILSLAMLALPGGPRLQADTGKVVIKVATMVPRTQDIVVQEKRYNQRLSDASNGRIQFKTYYGGSAGDDNEKRRNLSHGQATCLNQINGKPRKTGAPNRLGSRRISALGYRRPRYRHR